MIAIAVLVLLGLPRPAQLAGWGAKPLRVIQKELFRADRGIYCEAGSPADRPIDLKTEARLVLAFSAACAYEPKFKAELLTAIASAAHYLDGSGEGAGFDDTPFSKGGARSYADNATLALALLEAARTAASDQAARLAEAALRFALGGEGSTGGGIAVSPDDSTKSADSTGATALAILRQVDQSTPKHARELYAWMRANLRDPASNLIVPLAMSPDKPRPAPEAGDVGTLIELACALYLSNHDEMYAEQSRRLELLSLARWLAPTGALNTWTTGGTTLLEAWLDRIRICPRVYEVFGATVEAISALEKLHAAGSDRAGRYGRRFAIAPRKDESWRVIDQAACARAFFVGALALRAKH